MMLCSSVSAILFLSTPSARRATAAKGQGNIHVQISIHALREEGDVWSVRTTARPIIFLSTPSARRATLLWEHWKEFMGISIHALREEGDRE